MAILPPNLDYTNRDFDALRERLIALVRSAFPDWSDFDVAGFGTLLIEMYAFVGDIIGYYQDNLARESRLSTATQRKNVIALARMLGYQPYGLKAATAQVTFSLANAPAAPVVIPAGTVVRTKEVTDPVRFRLLEDVTITQNDDPPEAIGIAEHAEPRTKLYQSQGLADLDITLDYTPYLDGSTQVTAANGTYEEQPSLLGSGPNDRHFMVLVDENDRATVRFGNGNNGTPPTGTIQLKYKTGGGTSGNVEANSLTVIDGSFADTHGNPVQVRANNPQPAAGGSNRQSVNSIKQLAPQSLQTLTRTVTRKDFETNALRVPGVARALMLTSNEDLTILENTGILFIVPTSGTELPQTLHDAVLAEVTEVYPHTLTLQVSVQQAAYRTINIKSRIYLRQGVNPTEIRERTQANLEQKFRVSLPDGTPNPDIDFGYNIKNANGDFVGEVAWSDVFNVIRDTTGVRKMGDGYGDLLLNGLPSDVRLNPKEFPLLGEMTLIDGDTGAVL